MTVYRGEQTGSPVLAWTKEVRHKDEDIAEPTGPAKTLKNLYTQQCQLDRTPSYAADLAEITRLANTINRRIQHTQCMRAELERVIECADHYTNTTLPEPPAATARITYPEARILPAQATKQEAAQVALEQALNAANQKIATLRRI
ncbi:hypothetical protein AB0N97_40320 [Streptomyces collinus]|uniref:hypothetical protein n=1 Tax=Streptomyces collinus TaxID=42684 RepID=UPI00343FD476